jgi:hypothetical protein
VAAVLAAIGFDGDAITWASASSPDLRPARRVAVSTGLRHRVLQLASDHVAGGAAECVWLGETRRGSLRSYELALRSLRPGADSLVYCLRGDDSARLERAPECDGEAEWAAAVHAARARFVSDRLLDEVLAPPFAAELRGRAAAALAEQLSADEGDRQARFQQLRAANLPSPRLIDDHLAVRDPYADGELTEFLRRLPYELRREGRLQHAYLRSFPSLARVASPKEGTPPFLRGSLDRAARSTIHLRRRFRRASGAFADIAPGLRARDGELLGTLLEPRTLERGQLRAEGVGRLVSHTLRGRTTYIRALEALLLLELFQRLFVDEEGAAEGG